MKIHRFYLKNIFINNENMIVTQETSLIHQIKNVLRYKKGDILNIFNEEIGELEVELYDISKKDMSFIYKRHVSGENLSNKIGNNITLYMSLIKSSNFELTLEKAVELGVKNVVPIISERSIRYDFNLERFGKIIKEATEQCGRCDLMDLSRPLALGEILKTDFKESSLYFGSLSENDFGFITGKKQEQQLGLFIGPEGGFSENEISLFKECNVKPISLGSYVLRAETAAIVGVAVLSIKTF